jgi:hypothetical protein
MLRGTAGLRIAVKELTVLRDEAERRVRDNPTPALPRQARIDLQNIERTLAIAMRRLAPHGLKSCSTLH